MHWLIKRLRVDAVLLATYNRGASGCGERAPGWVGVAKFERAVEEVVGRMLYGPVCVVGRSLEPSVHRMGAGLALQSTLMERNGVSISPAP